ncbi:GntR family transcriptional regulator YhfZ [Fictibacillus phosphorivorans]|uniref:GntR family transcriptional regulator YhfZ n=1 Tax=Fictibacillus phosphorivorans TaxID=1221500 RepID=UPI003CF024E4
MEIFEPLYSKKVLVLQKIAEELLFVDVNERIPKIGELADKYQVGRGTIQTALKNLESVSCIKLDSRGHLGTFLRAKDISCLLKYAGTSRIIGVMPLPYSKKYEGLASGFNSEFEKLDLNLNIAFMRGAKLRLEGVKEGRYDFALVSKYSALEAIKENKELEIVLRFGTGTYVSKHAVIFADVNNKEVKSGMKIGIDSFSTDQKTLTMAETKDLDVDYVDLNYMHLLQHLKAKSIDAAIWNTDEIDLEMYHTSPLSSTLAKKEELQITEAVCVIRKNNKKLEYMLNLISINQVIETQRKVEEGKRIPKY